MDILTYIICSRHDIADLQLSWRKTSTNKIKHCFQVGFKIYHTQTMLKKCPWLPNTSKCISGVDFYRFLRIAHYILDLFIFIA